VLNLLSKLSISWNLWNDVLILFLEGAELTFDSQKRKLSVDCDNESSSKCSRTSYSKNVQTSLQRQINSLDAQLLEYQTKWMREFIFFCIHHLIENNSCS
jgi:protein associated with RNAse G/E